MKTVFKISLNNFAAYKKIYVKIICALVALLFLIALICNFVLSVQARQRDILYGSISANYAYTDKILNDGDVEQSYQTTQVRRVVTDEEICKELLGYGVHLWNDDVAIEYDGERRQFRGDPCVWTAYVANEDIFTQNDYKEAGADVNFLIGRYPQSVNEVVLSERYLADYRLSRDVLGKTVTLVAVKRIYNVSSETDENQVEYSYTPLIENVTVCGIITEDYYELSGHGSFAPTVLCREQSELAQFGLQTEYIYSLDEWADKRTEKFFKDNDVYYEGQYLLDQINVTVNLRMVINQLVAYFGSALIFGIVFTLILLCEKLCSAQMKNSGELLVQGLTNRSLFCVWLVQLCLASFIALVVASLLTLGATYGINKIIYDAFRLTLSVSAATFFVIIAIGLALLAVITVVALGYFALRFRGKQIRELLDV